MSFLRRIRPVHDGQREQRVQRRRLDDSRSGHDVSAIVLLYSFVAQHIPHGTPVERRIINRPIWPGKVYCTRGRCRRIFVKKKTISSLFVRYCVSFETRFVVVFNSEFFTVLPVIHGFRTALLNEPS